MRPASQLGLDECPPYQMLASTHCEQKRESPLCHTGLLVLVLAQRATARGACSDELERGGEREI